MVAQYRFLFDECLSPDLVAVANGAGHFATHVNFLDRSGASDRSLSVKAFESDAVFVTNNGADYRRIYREFELHPGLIVILPSVSRTLQPAFFLAALNRLVAMSDCINLLVEVGVDYDVTVVDWAKDWRSNT